MRSIKYQGRQLPRRIENPEIELLKETVDLLYFTEEVDRDGLVRHRAHCKHYILDEYSVPLEEPGTLGGVETYLFNRYGEMLPCMVITEYGLSGTIYRYGNRGGFWEATGETCGYA